MFGAFLKERVSIAVLQETHLSSTEHAKLKSDWVGQVYFSYFSSNKRGTSHVYLSTKTQTLKDDLF